MLDDNLFIDLLLYTILKIQDYKNISKIFGGWHIGKPPKPRSVVRCWNMTIILEFEKGLPSSPSIFEFVSSRLIVTNFYL